MKVKKNKSIKSLVNIKSSKSIRNYISKVLKNPLMGTYFMDQNSYLRGQTTYKTKIPTLRAV